MHRERTPVDTIEKDEENVPVTPLVNPGGPAGSTRVGYPEGVKSDNGAF